jgi:hypothetical protein
VIGILFLITAVGFLVTAILPILSFVRLQQANRRAESMRDRIAQLEIQVARLSAQVRHQPPELAGNETSSIAIPPEIPVAPTPVAPLPEPEPPAPVIPVATPPLAQPRSANSEGLEQLIGSRWLLYLGLAGLVLGMSYFVKYAFDNGWVSEELRVVASVVTGLALIGAGIRFSTRGLGLFGQALSGAGVVVLYVAIYAALHFYGLVTEGPAFVLMVLVTAGAAFLSHREKSQSLAILALVGGFMTPMLVGGDRQVQVVLFTYIGVLLLGTVALVRLHRWPSLTVISYVCTFALVLLWLIDSYQPEGWLQLELFLTGYLAIFLYLLWSIRREQRRDEASGYAQAALFTAPVGFHGASLYLLGRHDAALLSYFLLFTIGGLVVAALSREARVRVATLLLVGIPFMIWMNDLQSPRWYAPAVLTVCVIYVLHLASQWHALSGEPGSELPVSEAIHAQVNGLLLPLTLYVFFVSRFDWWNPRMAAILSVINGGIAWGMRTRLPALRRQYVALAATLAAVAVALVFDGPVVALGWSIEGAVLGWIALNERRRMFAVASAVMLAMGAVQLSIVLQDPLAVGSLPLLNSRALVVILVIGVLTWLISRMKDDPVAEVKASRNALVILANLLALGLLSADINAYFSQRALNAEPGEVRTVRREAGLMQQVALSVTWAAYGVGLIAVGIRWRYAPARYLAMLLLAVTVVKVMTRDIAELDRFYRMLSVLAVGVLLVLASYLYQRMGRQDGEAHL